MVTGRSHLSVFAALVTLLASSVEAQQGITVQLPTFSFFSVATTVVVPDSGGAYMGGINRAGLGRNRIGTPFGQGPGALGATRQAAGMQVGAQIHDLQEMDKALLGTMSQQVAAAQPAAKKESLTSLQEIERQRGMQEDARQAEAADFLRRGRDALAAGKASLARTYYQMALRRATGELKEAVAAQLKQLDSPRLAAQP